MKNDDNQSLFARLHPDIRTKLPKLMHEVFYVAGEQIYTQGELCPTFNILVSGQVRIIRVRPDGHETTLCTHRPGSFFCSLSVLDGSLQLGTAYAVTDVILLRADRAKFNELCKEFPQLLSLVQETCLKDMRRHIARFEMFTFLSVEERLAQTLLEESLACQDTGEPAGELCVTQQDLANLIGASRESVSRILSKWERKGLTFCKRERIIIRNRDELERLCFNWKSITGLIH